GTAAADRQRAGDRSDEPLGEPDPGFGCATRTVEGVRGYQLRGHRLQAIRRVRLAAQALRPVGSRAPRAARVPRPMKTLAYPRRAQVPACHISELRERQLRLFDLGVPALLPLEAEVSAVPDLHERLDLPLHRYLARAGEHVAAVVARGDRILEMRVPDVAPELPYRVLRCFLARDEGVVRIPEQRHGW